MLSYNPLLPFGFDDTGGDVSIFIKDEEGNDIDITEYVAQLKSQIDGKVNIFQGSTQGNKVIVTDPQGNITTVAGVVMNQAERDKLASLSNIMLLKGILNTYEELYQVENPQVGWCYYVKYADGENDNIYEEYVYTADGRWEMFGHFNADKIPQYLGGVGTDIDTNFRVNLLFNPENFEIDEQNRLKLKEGQGGGGISTINAGTATEIGDNNTINVKYDPNYLVIDENGRLSLKYKIRIWDELGGQGGSGGSSGSGSGETISGL